MIDKKNVDKQSEEALTVPDMDPHALLAQGKRHLVCSEIPNAIETLQKACELAAEKYGEVADECGEFYFFYGKARLELARMESGVLGNALTGVPEDGDTEDSGAEGAETEVTDGGVVVEKYDASKVEEAEREELAAQVYDAMSEKEENQEGETMETTEQTDKTETDKKIDERTEKETEDETKKSEVETEKSEETEDKTEKSVDTEETTDKPTEESEDTETDDNKENEKTEDEETEEGTEEEMEEDKDEEDVSNIQLAWETIDLARVIFARQENKESQLRAAQAHLKLGEVSLELENYDQAVKDFTECLTIQKKHLVDDDRLIAETCYQLGVAHSYNRQYPEARERLSQALTTVQQRKVHLEESLSKTNTENNSEESVKSVEDELKDLAEIIPDIEAKIKDTEDEEREVTELVKSQCSEIAEVLSGSMAGSSSGLSSSSSGFSGSSETSKPVNVLVPRKRKAEDEVPEDSKKQRQESGDDKATNGDQKHSNGLTQDKASNGSNGDESKEKASNGDETKETSSNGDHSADKHSIGDHSGQENGKSNGDKSEKKTGHSNGAGDSIVDQETSDDVKVKTVEEVLEKKSEADAKMDTS